MQCQACGAQNRVGRKFCAQCGTALISGCPQCGTAPEAGDRFCGNCGAALYVGDAFPAAPPGTGVPEVAVHGGNGFAVAERRVCAILFVDLVGFTPLSEARDPEEVRELLSRYFESARTVIGRYGGVVEKFIGDAVMAVWGTPVAVEGDAERAVRAGLDVVAAVALLGEEVAAPGLQARAGVVTGEVAVTVGAVGEGVAGDAVNTAARVQTAARAGEVWVDEATYRLARAAIGFVDAGEHTLKGKSEPMRLWAATRVLSGVGGAQRVDGLEAPLVGRDAELRTIKELFHAAVERRSPRLVLISGPAGVGKSRLAWEFDKYVDGLAETVWWHRGRCPAYGEGVAFWGLAEMVRQRLNIAEDDAAAVVAQKLDEGLHTYLVDDETRNYVRPRLSRLLGVASAAGTATPFAQEELFAGWRIFFERLAASAPVVLLLEDAHYADAGLLDFLDHLVDWAREVPLYVLVFSRPELVEARPGWGTGRNRTTLTLDPLDAVSMGRLVDALVPDMPSGSRDAITTQAQGIPLFAVETIRSLIDQDIVVPRDGVYRLVRDVGGLSVPDSLRALLAARLDALDGPLRSLVADAAVLGTTFPADALVAVSGRDPEEVRAALADLVRREVFEVSAEPLSPQRGSYGFSHSLLQQVAYETLSRRDRKARHLAVATHLRSSFDADGEEVVDVVARHYLDALAAVPGDPDTAQIRQEAAATLVRAGERALGSGAPRAASSQFAAAARLAAESQSGDADLAAAQLLERAASAMTLAGAGTDVLPWVDEAMAIYEKHGNRRAAARVDAIGGAALWDVRRYREGRERLNRALEVLREDPDHDTVAALSELASIESLTATPDADAVSAEALVLGQQLDVDLRQLATLFIVRGIAVTFSNRAHEALAYLEYAIRIAEQAGDGATLGRAFLNKSTILLTTDPAGAATAARAAADHLRRVGASSMLAVAAMNLMNALMLIGEWDEAEALITTTTEEDGIADTEAILLGRILLDALRGDVAAAAAAAGDGNLRATEDVQNQAYVVVADLAIAVAKGDADEALRLIPALNKITDAIGLRHETFTWGWPLALQLLEVLDSDQTADVLRIVEKHPPGDVPPLLRAEYELARARLGAGTSAGSVDGALDILRRFGSPYHLAHGLLDVAACHLADGESAVATPLVDEAAAIARALRAMPLLARAEQLDLELSHTKA